MSWRYVPCRQTHISRDLAGGEIEEEVWSVREYYVDIPGCGDMWSMDAISAYGQSLLELKADLGNMRADVRDAVEFLDLDADPPRLRPLEDA